VIVGHGLGRWSHNGPRSTFFGDSRSQRRGATFSVVVVWAIVAAACAGQPSPGEFADPLAGSGDSITADSSAASPDTSEPGTTVGTTPGTSPGTDVVGTPAPPATIAPPITVPPTTATTKAPDPPRGPGEIPFPGNGSSAPKLGSGVPARLQPPGPVDLGGPPAFAGEGQWSPIGPLANGAAAMYVTNLRSSGGSTNPIAVAWLDPGALRARLHPGYGDPISGGFITPSLVPSSEFPMLAAAMNGGFKTTEYPFGFYLDGKESPPMQFGKATFAIDADGVPTIGEWGRDISVFDGVKAARQNLTLLVDGGRPVGGLNPNDTSVWGATLNRVVWTPRSGVGVRSDGSLVWTGGPLNITALANILTQAGAVRAMELDINPQWVAFNWFTFNGGTLQSYKLAPNASRDPNRFVVNEERDFFSFLTR